MESFEIIILISLWVSFVLLRFLIKRDRLYSSKKEKENMKNTNVLSFKKRTNHKSQSNGLQD